jgi:hypothetical protein
MKHNLKNGDILLGRMLDLNVLSKITSTVSSFPRTINSYTAHQENICSYTNWRAIAKKNAVFWDVAPCRSCVNRRFGGTYRLHLQGRKIRERGTSVSRWLQLIYVPLKRRFTQDLHAPTSQKSAFFIVTAVKISNLTIIAMSTNAHHLTLSWGLTVQLNHFFCSYIFVLKVPFNIILQFYQIILIEPYHSRVHIPVTWCNVLKSLAITFSIKTETLWKHMSLEHPLLQ